MFMTENVVTCPQYRTIRTINLHKECAMIKGWGIFFLIIDALFCIGWGSHHWLTHRCISSMSGSIPSALLEAGGAFLAAVASCVFYVPLNWLVHHDLTLVIILGVIGIVCMLLPADD